MAMMERDQIERLTEAAQSAVEIDGCQECGLQGQDALDLLAESERLRKALEKFGSHHYRCSSWRRTARDCDCGFIEALEGDWRD